MALDFKITDNQIRFEGLIFRIPDNLDEQGKKIFEFASKLFEGYASDITNQGIEITENIKNNISKYWHSISTEIKNINSEKVQEIFNSILKTSTTDTIKTMLDSYSEACGDRDSWADSISKTTTDYLFDRRKETFFESKISWIFLPNDKHFEHCLFLVIRKILIIEKVMYFAQNHIQDAVIRNLYTYFKEFQKFGGPREEQIDFTNEEKIIKEIANVIINVKSLPTSVKSEIIECFKLEKKDYPCFEEDKKITFDPIEKKEIQFKNDEIQNQSIDKNEKNETDEVKNNVQILKSEDSEKNNVNVNSQEKDPGVFDKETVEIQYLGNEKEKKMKHVSKQIDELGMDFQSIDPDFTSYFMDEYNKNQVEKKKSEDELKNQSLQNPQNDRNKVEDRQVNLNQNLVTENLVPQKKKELPLTTKKMATIFFRDLILALPPTQMAISGIIVGLKVTKHFRNKKFTD